MNDKICVFLPNNHFEQTSEFNNNFSHRRFEMITPQGEITEKLSYHLNSENFQADINDYGLLVKCNPNKINNHIIGTGLLEYGKFTQSVKQVETELSDRGLKCHLTSSKVVRADDSFDLPITLSYKYYSPIVRTLAPIKINRAEKQVIENTLYLGNKSNKITIYDKQTEANLINPMMRIEYRHLKNLKMNFTDIKENQYYKFRADDKKKIDAGIFSINPGVLDSEYLPYFLEQVETDNTRSVIVQNVFYYVLSNEQDKTGINLLDHLKVKRQESNKLYIRNQRFITEISKQRHFSSELVERYNEMKTLFNNEL